MKFVTILCFSERDFFLLFIIVCTFLQQPVMNVESIDFINTIIYMNVSLTVPKNVASLYSNAFIVVRLELQML